jgi:hypothetical protein
MNFLPMPGKMRGATATVQSETSSGLYSALFSKLIIHRVSETTVRVGRCRHKMLTAVRFAYRGGGPLP